MTRRAIGLEHPVIEPKSGVPLDEAGLGERERLAIVLQAAGLLSLCEVAGYRLRDGFESARVDGDGRLRAVAVEPGTGEEGSLLVLAGLTRRLFRGGERIAGRSVARKAARKLVGRWSSALDGGSADRAVSSLLEEAPFLAGPRFATAREALRGAFVRDGERCEWVAGRRGAAPSGGACTLAELVAAGRWRDAVRLGRDAPPADAADRLLLARALWATGKVEQAIFVLGDDRSVPAEALRAEGLMHLGELGAAREAIRRLERLDLSCAERIAAGDVALRVLAASGEPAVARDWAARAIASARGANQRRGAELLAALAALDRGDEETASRLLAAEPVAAGDPHERLDLDARVALAMSQGDDSQLLALARLRLARGRRRMGTARAGRAWDALGTALSLRGDFAAAERAYSHGARLLRRCDGPLAITLAGFNLAETRLRVGKLSEVESIVTQSAAHNRRSGNVLGLAEDELLAVRLALVQGDWEGAVARARRFLDSPDAELAPATPERFAVLAARALGWLGRPLEAREALALAGEAALREIEPEELPFLFALAGDTDGAASRADLSPFPALARPLVAGEAPDSSRWSALGRLEPFRRARFVLDAELMAPGAAPLSLRGEAAAIFQRLGAGVAARICERGDRAAWQALGRYFTRPAGERAAIEELFAAIGHPEAELVYRSEGGEERWAGAGPRRDGSDERLAAHGGGELVLRATEIDAPLRALFELFRRELVAPVTAERAPTSTLLGQSPALASALERLEKFASSELPVLILGENGTGKELAAAEVHRRSSRRKGPWVPVNCAGLSDTLLLSELFGHARGAFTGADQPRVGVFETGRGGTVFLDEIGDLPLPAQGALLRVLQEKEIRRLGESMPRKVDVRIVAATNRDLETMVEQGSFRQDLFFRLKVAIVSLPPLRERGADVPLLADRFLAEIRARGRDVRFAPEARRALTAHTWPGNVRELRNTLEAAAALAAGGVITPEDLDLRASVSSTGDGDYHRQVDEFRRRLIQRALEASDGSLAGAARQLGVTRQFLSQFARQHALEVKR